MFIEKVVNLIEKEDIPSFKFPKGEVLKDKLRIDLRSHNLKKALKLGNKFRNKVHIFFEDSASRKKVETTIWGITEKYIILKKNTLIPIERIYSVNI